ncbi:CapA family protein, partial [Bacillus cereus]|nr:CapA family protein [Bacillus cereus]
VTDYADGKKQFKIQFLKDYSDENSKKHGIKKFVGPVSLKDFKEIPRDVLGNWYKD